MQTLIGRRTEVERVMAHFGVTEEAAKDLMDKGITVPPRGAAGIELGPGRITESDIRKIATRTADEVMARVREQEQDTLVLNSIPYAYGSPGIVVNEAVAKASPCRCIEYRPGKYLCFSKGVVGALSDPQEALYCNPRETMESPGLQKRMESWMEAMGVCKAEIAPIPKGERLEPWLSCMSRELAARGVEA